MIFKLQFNKLNKINSELKTIVNDMEIAISKMKPLLEDIHTENVSEAFDKLKVKNVELLTNMEKVKKEYEKKQKQLESYINGVDDNNNYQVEDKEYYIDTSVLYDNITSVSEPMNYEVSSILETVSPERLDFSAMETDMSDFYNVDENIDLDREYNDNEDIKNYIKDKRVNINQKIDNFKYNKDYILPRIEEEYRHIVKETNNFLDEIQDILKMSYGLEDFEKKFDKGWWADNGQWVHLALDGVGVIPGIGWVADLVNASIYAIEGDWGNAGLSALGAIPGLGAGVLAAKMIGKGAKFTKYAEIVAKGAKAFEKGEGVYNKFIKSASIWKGRSGLKIFGKTMTPYKLMKGVGKIIDIGKDTYSSGKDVYTAYEKDGFEGAAKQTVLEIVGWKSKNKFKNSDFMKKLEDSKLKYNISKKIFNKLIDYMS